MVAIEPGGPGMRTRVVLLGLLVFALLYPTSSDAVLRSRETRQAFAAPPLLRSGLLQVARNSDTLGSSRASAPMLAPPLSLAGSSAPSPKAARLRQGGLLQVRATAADQVALGREVTQTEMMRGVGPVKGGWGPMVGLEEEALLPEDPNLIKGALRNGLRYSILRNKVPPKRFYVNLEVHAGSIDETDDQQV